MSLRIDPQGVELKALRTAIAWRGKRVLEIGSGAGRLARRLVRLGASVIATDPDKDQVHTSAASRPKTYRTRLEHAVAAGEQLPFASGSFDVVVFGWSL